MGGSGTYVNGTSSTDDTTYYIYDNPGTYTVILTITDTNDCQHSDTNTVIVRPNPIAAFVSDSVCVGFNTTLISTSISDPSYQTISGTIQSWDWEFGDSQDSCCVEDTIQHTYTTDGIYTAQLIVIDSYGCSDTITNSVVVNPGPIASFSATTECEGDPTVFTNNSYIDSLGATITTYLWDMGGSGTYVNGTNSNSPEPEYLYDSKVEYIR